MKSSIRTRYNGTLFRSKLEADWARAFDSLGVVWEYEREGQYFGDVFYLPDFWLPKSRQYVEVKGVFEPADCKKIRAVVETAKPRPYTGDWWCPDIPIIACVPDGKFYGWERKDEPAQDWYEFLTTSARHISLFECTECRGWWFCDGDQSFRCQCCGAYDGDHFVSDRWDSPLPRFPDLSELRAHRDLPRVS
jgi:hypothetical protein